MAAHSDQTHVTQNTKVFGDGRLFQAKGRDNFCDGPLGSSKVTQNLSPAGFSNCVESV
jgi:hypothetical protein